MPGCTRIAHLVERGCQRHPVAKRHLPRALDGGTVGQRVAEGDADLGGDAPGALRASQERAEAVECRVPGREVRDQPWRRAVCAPCECPVETRDRRLRCSRPRRARARCRHPCHRGRSDTRAPGRRPRASAASCAATCSGVRRLERGDDPLEEAELVERGQRLRVRRRPVRRHARCRGARCARGRRPGSRGRR